MAFFFWARKLLTAINTCLDEMEEFKGRDIAFVTSVGSGFMETVSASQRQKETE